MSSKNKTNAQKVVSESRMDRLFPHWSESRGICQNKKDGTTIEECIVPQSMLDCVESWKRISELAQCKNEQRLEGEAVSSEAVHGALQKGHWSLDWLYVNIQTVLAAKVRHFLKCSFGDLQRKSDHACFLWESIKEESEDASKAYLVRLFIMGRWREVKVDDQVPVDHKGDPLFISMSPSQIWPLVITKAILRVMHAYNALNIDSSHQMSFYHWLTGWPTEHLSTQSNKLKGGELFRRLEDILNKTNNDEARTPVAICFAHFNDSENNESVLCSQENNSKEQLTENTSKIIGRISDIPKPLVICGTTGCKKRNLISQLLNELPQYFESVPVHTTKPSKEAFKGLENWILEDEDFMHNEIEAGKYLFHEEVYSWLYGYNWTEIESVRLSGKVPVILLDNLQLLSQIKEQQIDCFVLFIQSSPSQDLASNKVAELHGEYEMLSIEDVGVSYKVVESATENEVSYHRLLQELHKLYPQILPTHAVWGLGRQLWDPSSRIEGRRPVQVIVLGPNMDPMTTLSKGLSQAFQVPFFTYPELIKDDLEGPLRDVSDDFIVGALARQFNCKECLARGWILAGFPLTKAQQTAMETRGIIPDKVILLNSNLSESDEAEANEKVAQNNPTDQSLKGDDIDLSKECLDDAGHKYKENIEELQKAFSEISLNIPDGSTFEEALQLASSFIRLESVCDWPLLPQATTPQGYISSVMKFCRQCMIGVSDYKGNTQWVEASRLVKKVQHLTLLHNPKIYNFVKNYTREDLEAVAEDLVLKVNAKTPGEVLISLDVGLEEEGKQMRASDHRPFVFSMKKIEADSITNHHDQDPIMNMNTQTHSCQSIDVPAGPSLYSVLNLQLDSKSSLFCFQIKTDRSRPYSLDIYSNSEIEFKSIDQTLEDLGFLVTSYTGEIQTPQEEDVIAPLFCIEIRVEMPTEISAEVSLNHEPFERNLYLSLDNEIQLLNHCPFANCEPQAGSRILNGVFQRPRGGVELPRTVKWKLRVIAKRKSIQFDQLPIQEVRRFSGSYEHNLNRRFCRYVITTKAKTVLFIALGLSNASPQFVFRVVDVARSGVRWKEDAEEVEVVYFGTFADLACIPCVRLDPGKYLIEAAFENVKTVPNGINWNLLVSPSCSPGSLDIQPDQSKQELVKESVKQWMEEKGSLKTRSARATEALQKYENNIITRFRKTVNGEVMEFDL